MDGVLGRKPLQWNFRFQQRPRCGSGETGLRVSVLDGHGESALQSGLMAAEFAYDRRKTMSGKGSLRLWQSRDGLGLGPRVLGQIPGKKRGHGCGVFAHLLNRAGKPLVNRAIHQAICKKEHHDDREERKQQASDHQPSSELGAQDAEPSLSKQLQQIAGQHKCEGYEKEKNYGG